MKFQEILFSIKNRGNALLIILIIACEIGFWILLLTGLGARYVLKMPKTGKVLLMSIPLLDLILLGATILDLRQGSYAEFAHGLAAAYLGFTIIFGRSVMEWADEHIAYRFGAGKKPIEKFGTAYTLHEWKLWIKGLLACCVTAGLLYMAIIFVNDPNKTGELKDWYYHLVSLMFFWLIFGPLWYSMSPKKSPNNI